MNSETAANLLGLLSRVNQFNRSDWFSDVMKEAVEVMRAQGVARAASNIYGDQIVLTDSTVTINGRTWSV
jgi:hypothetical protein